MSKHNKANKSNYIQAGRLTSDEMARERAKQDPARKPPAHDETVRGHAGAKDPTRQRNHGGEASTGHQTGNEE
jgi:hypothetical protein